MGLFNSLVGTANTMNAYERSLLTIQNNVANASTPGFARQRQEMVAQRFDLDVGIAGGVRAGAVFSYRSESAERAVRDANEQFSKYDQLATDLSQVEPLLPVSAGAGLPASLDRFFQAASQASVSPNDSASREVLLDRAQDVATDFNRVSNGLGDVRANIDDQIRGTVGRVNEIAAELAEINAQQGTTSGDAGLDATANRLLEELSGLVNYQSVQQDDGSISLYAAGSLLLIGDRSYPLALDAAAGERLVRDRQGEDITAKLTGGRLGGQLEAHNREIPGLQARLDAFATEFADEVNTVLEGGLDQYGTPPSTPLFRYETAGPASTLAVNPLSAEQLALASAGEPGGNGNAIELTNLAIGRNTAGKTFAQTYGDLSAEVGRKVLASRGTAEVRGQIYAQAKTIREDAQGVSLDEEAAQLIQAQRAYQAAAQLFRTLNELTDAAISLGR